MYGFTGAHIVVDVVGWIRKQTNNVFMCDVRGFCIEREEGKCWGSEDLFITAGVMPISRCFRDWRKVNSLLILGERVSLLPF